MKKTTILLGLSLTFLSTIAPPAIADTIPTMNQPNNGFYEEPNPEWATLHSTNGTVEHRQYHRDVVQAHLLWHTQHLPEKGTTAYGEAHRLYHQEMNMLHRDFHAAHPNP